MLPYQVEIIKESFCCQKQNQIKQKRKMFQFDNLP